MSCTSCRYHDPKGSTFFGTCRYFEQLGREAKSIEDTNVYRKGCYFYAESMVCYSCNKKVTYEDSDPASYEKDDEDRCCFPCLQKIIKETIKEVKGMQGIVRI